MRTLVYITTLVASCFCMVSHAFAQAGEHYHVYGHRYMEAQLCSSVTGEPYSAYSDSIGQRIHLESTAGEATATLHSIRSTALDPYSLTDEQATLTLFRNSPYGELVTAVSFMIPGLNRVFPAEELDDSLSLADVSTKANQYWMASTSGGYSFDLLATEVVLDLPLDTGYYVFVISTDPSILHEYSSGESHAPQIVCLTNFTTADPYPEGYALIGGCVGQGGDWLREVVLANPFDPWSNDSLRVDMAFEFTVSEDFSTFVSEQPSNTLVVPMNSGEIIVPTEWSGGILGIYDLSGRELFSKMVFGSETINRSEFADTQMIFVTLTKDGKRRTAKVVVV